MSNGHRLWIWLDEDNNTIINYEDLRHGEDRQFVIFPDGRATFRDWGIEGDGYLDTPVDLVQALIELAHWLETERE